VEGSSFFFLKKKKKKKQKAKRMKMKKQLIKPGGRRWSRPWGPAGISWQSGWKWKASGEKKK
jgi:hypothetical protein